MWRMCSVLKLKACQISWRKRVCALKTAHKVLRIWLDQQAWSCVCSETTQVNKLYYDQDVYHIQLLSRSGIFKPPVTDVCSCYMQRASACMLRIWISKHLSTCLALSSLKDPLKLMAYIFKGDRAVFINRSQRFCEQPHVIVSHSLVTGLKKDTWENAERLRMGVCSSTAPCESGASSPKGLFNETWPSSELVFLLFCWLVVLVFLFCWLVILIILFWGFLFSCFFLNNILSFMYWFKIILSND